MIGNGIHVDGRPSAPSGCPPLLGQHTDAVLREVGLDDADIAALRDKGGI
ncbi:hypothetical protein [Nonomuraea cypriaca]|nr:hypothetical protein [Nonomuraea cypriaca]